jgi:hypothetical protein
MKPETDIEQLEIEGWGDEEEDVIPFRYSITSYGADYPVESLVKRMKTGDIFIPHFQRGYVWNLTDASRFVETLLLGLPVPGIFLSKEYESEKLLVIDGQQRLRTLQYFYEGVFDPKDRVFALRGVQSQYIGVTYKTLEEQDRRRLDDSIIHLTIVRQDEPSDDDSSIYHIFERLNTTGRPLSPQEIRVCLYHGEFNNLLGQLNEDEAWRSIFGKVNPRMRDQELILRFLALYFYSDRYEKPIKGFLNRYMKLNRHLALQSTSEVEKAFLPTVQLISESLGNRAFKPRRALNAAVFDSVMIGVARRLNQGEVTDLDALQTQYRTLLENEDFVRVTQESTSDEENVRRRIELATDFFDDLE